MAGLVPAIGVFAVSHQLRDAGPQVCVVVAETSATIPRNFCKSRDQN
jgi:hypothetical protein